MPDAAEPQAKLLTALQLTSIPATQEPGQPSPLRSWIAEGPNEPVTGEQVTLLVGEDALTALADAVGKDTTEVAEQLAVTLPRVVDAASPEGQLPPGSVQARISQDGRCDLFYLQGIAAIAPVAAPDQYWALGS